MDNKSRHLAYELYHQVQTSIDTHRIGEAIYALGSVQCVYSDWETSQTYKQIQEDYQQMVAYMSKGIKDTQRDTLYQDISRRVFELNNHILTLNLADSPEEYYAIRRYIKQCHLHITQEVQRIEKLSSELRHHCNTHTKTLQQRYTAQLSTLYLHSENLFRLALTSTNLSAEDVEVLEHLLHNEEIVVEVKTTIITALSLGCYHLFDIKKIKLLSSILSHQDPLLQARAIVGTLMLLTKYDSSLATLYPVVYHSLKATLMEHYASLITQLAQYCNTQHLTPKISQAFNIDLIQQIAKSDETSHTDFIEHLRLLYDRKADLHYATFSRMKHRFSFFKEMVNWFIPFTSSHPYLQEKLLPNDTLSSLKLPLCYSDRYSLAILLSNMPRDTHQELLQQIDAHQPATSISTSSDITIESHQEVVYYLQDLYRFFTLYSRDKAWGQWFADFPSLTSSSIITSILHTTGSLSTLADDAFSLKLYDQAMAFYQAHESLEGLNAEQAYRLGVCFEHKNSLKEAMGYYEKADLLSPNTSKILYSLGHGAKKMGNIGQALHYFKAYELLDPDNIEILLTIGNLLLQLNFQEEALNYYYKADYLNGGESESTKAIAWCSFLMGHNEQAEKKYNKLLTQPLTNEDYIKAGHFYWSIGRIEEAINCYINVDTNIADFIRHDTPLLLSKGISPIDIALMCDWLTYHKHTSA